MKKKKIIHLVNSKIYSGLEKVVIDIIKELNNEFDFYYACQDGDIVNIVEKNNINRIKINGINKKEIIRIEKEYNPDIIHAHDYTAALFCGLFVKKTPVIVHLHNNPLWLKKIYHPYNYLLLNSFSNKNVKKIYIVSKSVEEEYVFSKMIRNKIRCIGNPVSRTNILSKVVKGDCNKEYDICCVARLTMQKNPFKFLRILEGIKIQIPNVKCIWVGDGELKHKMLERICELDLKDNIELVGFKSNPYKYMANSKIFLLTSDWEGYGLVVFEALTLELPCVVSNVGGLSEIVNTNCGKLCSYDDEYIEECVRLLEDKNYYNIKKQNAKLRSEELENLSNYMKEIKESYNEVIKIG